jgi:hypothetical protein
MADRRRLDVSEDGDHRDTFRSLRYIPIPNDIAVFGLTGKPAPGLYHKTVVRGGTLISKIAGSTRCASIFARRLFLIELTLPHVAGGRIMFH